ncbi:MAG: carbohydrate kinase family protein [Alistipes sp.]|jgi:sugar/nucleoside kinase (ribokinase family)|nr:carbohydrate kinase family protein [Alistipes sp.]
MKKIDVVALGELNADLILNRIDSMPVVGKEIYAHDMLLTLGSSTAIFAANAASMGVSVAFAGMIGRDSFGDLVKSTLRSRGVQTDYIIETDRYATGATIVLSYGEDRANVTYQGAMDAMGIDDIDPALFDNARHIHISSIFMQSALKRDLPRILDLAAEKGCTVSLDTQWDPAEKWDFDYKALLPKITVFMPNKGELKLITGSDTIEEAITKIKPYLGHACVVKCGNKGSMLVTKEGERMLEPFLNTNVVDATGAGDSFNAGFIYGFVNGKPLEECQRIGNLTGAVNTTAAGGTGAFANRAEIDRRAKEFFGQTI